MTKLCVLPSDGATVHRSEEVVASGEAIVHALLEEDREDGTDKRCFGPSSLCSSDHFEPQFATRRTNKSLTSQWCGPLSYR